MNNRKSFTQLTLAERDAFLEAILLLKTSSVDTGLGQTNVYDQFVALHMAVMDVVVPTDGGGSEVVNMGHQAPGFLPWHRAFIRYFELALQAAKPGVTLPYWDWTQAAGTSNVLFSDAFLGPRDPQNPIAVLSGVFNVNAPTGAARPGWYPNGLSGWRIDQVLNDPAWSTLSPPFNQALIRIGDSSFSLPSAANLSAALQTDDFFEFWSVLEGNEGRFDANGNLIATHNALHNWVGGHMGTGGSPNDPIFFMHHANVDRLWAEWQKTHPGANHYPAASVTPQGDRIPSGHRLNDRMWPWVGTDTGYAPMNDSVLRFLRDFSGEPPLRPLDVLDTTSAWLDYQYS